MLRLVRAVPVVSLLVVLVVGLNFGGCTPLYPIDDGDDGLLQRPDLSGCWMATAVEAVAGANEEEVPAEIDVDFWHFARVVEVPGAATYEVTHPCEPGLVVGYAYLYDDLTVELEHTESGASVLTVLSDGDCDMLHALEEVDGAAWSACRVEVPDCNAVNELGEQLIGLQAVELDDESVDDPALVTGGWEEEEPIQGKAVAAKVKNPNGVKHLTASLGSRLTLGEESEDVTSQTTTCTAEGAPVDCTTAGELPGYVTCVEQGVSASRIQQLADVAALIDTDQVYPGALLQGKHFDGGSYVPVTIPRAAGTVTLSGLFGMGNSFSETVDEITYAKVNHAINAILTRNEITGTAANASYRMEAVNSANEWAFELGTHVKTVAADLKAAIDVGRSEDKNTIVLKFTQVFYTVSFEDPAQRTDVFADRTRFHDPEGQIGRGNPPLYVSSVKYGRQVFFFVSSSLSSSYVKSALSGAYNGVAASVTVDGKMSYKDVLARSEVTYIARGGDAGLALEPLRQAQPDQIYDALRALLADRNAANWSPQNPGIPVAYTLRYLDDRTVALKGFSTTYDRRDCHYVERPEREFILQVTDIDSEIEVWLDYMNSAGWKGYRKGGSYTAKINDWLTDDRDHKVMVKLTNHNCFKSHANFALLRDHVPVWSYRFHPCCWRCCGRQAEVHFVVNPQSGKFEVSYFWTGNH